MYRKCDQLCNFCEFIKMYLIVLRPLFSEKMVENVEMKQNIFNKLAFYEFSENKRISFGKIRQSVAMHCKHL